MTVKEEKKIRLAVLTTVSKTMDWFLVDTMRLLSENGYDVTLISNMEEGFAERNGDFATCVHLGMSRGASISDLFRSTAKLWHLFRKGRFDALYYTTPNASMYASVAGFFAGVKTRIYSQCGLRYVAFSGLRRFIFRAVEWLTCLFSTHVKAQSPKNLDFAVKERLCGRKKISVVGIGGTTGVDLSLCRAFDHAEARRSLRDKYAIPESAFVYGYVGRLNADKGLNELISAFRSLEGEVPGAHLVLVGMEDDQNPVSEENLRYAKESSRITLTGNVPPGEVYPHMAMFDVLTHPTYREGFGKVLQEAMGVGIPIITTNVPGPSEVVEDGVSGILCEAKNVPDLAEKMRLLYSNSALRESLASAGLLRAETYFDRPIMLNNILADMDGILKNEGGNAL